MQKRQKNWLFRVSILCLLLLLVVGCVSDLPFVNNKYQVIDNIKLVSRVEGEDILYYSNGNWEKRFWFGVNLGATIPGHYPGELIPTYEDYRRWFRGMEELGIDLLRIYTILPPHFYEALLAHNKISGKKLWLIQGIWSPEKELISEQNAYLPEITNKFHNEIALAVIAVHGDGEIPPIRGKASGTYSADVSSYLLAWMLGTEWYPLMVYQTDKINKKNSNFQGRYFKTAPGSTPFEAWLAHCLEILAAEEMKRGWQRPVSFVNWVTTDPLSHPDEPYLEEDLVSVDPMNILPTENWQAGYFAAYHVYPYYPDNLRFQEDYQQYRNREGKKDPYEAYLLELRRYHAGIPFIVAEFGVPSSRGKAHSGPLGRDQGMHNEYEQGKINVEMFQAIKNAGGTGAILFAWQDEWFKFTWNTWDLELPAERRAMWLNRLTNEEHFGLIAVGPGNWTRVLLDGNLDDWDEIEKLEKSNISDSSMKFSATSDEAYLYLAIERSENWNWEKEQLYIGFDNQPGGNKFANDMPYQFEQGLEFLLTIRDIDDATLKVASAYDQHTYLCGKVLEMIPWNKEWSEENNGLFLPWKLCLSGELYLPASQRYIPFEEIDIGLLVHGNSDPDSSEFNSLADFYVEKNILEIRIPWMMLGFTDPSSHQVWSFPYREDLRYFTAFTSTGLNMEILITDKNNEQLKKLPILAYNWKSWDVPTYHERRKQSYYLLQSFIENLQ